MKNHICTKNMVCPYCGYENDYCDDEEIIQKQGDAIGNHRCHKCDNIFEWQICQRHFQTSRYEESNKTKDYIALFHDKIDKGFPKTLGKDMCVALITSHPELGIDVNLNGNLQHVIRCLTRGIIDAFEEIPDSEQRNELYKEITYNMAMWLASKLENK